MTNNHSEENQQPSIQQEILNNSPVGGNLTMGNITQNINLTPPVQRPRNEKLLLQAVKDEVAARLKQSLHNAVFINLGKEAQPEQVKRPWSSDIKIGDKPSEPIPDDTSILEIFDSEDIAGKLLILGNPGAGKTTTMLDLAQTLVVRSQEDCDYPILVLFNLSTWKDDKQSIRDWLVLELKSKYGVRKDIGAKWVDDAKLLPMLDGLDELESARQEPCVKKINEFLQSDSRSRYVVVCSRREEYEKVVREQWEEETEEDLEEISKKQNTRLCLNGAVILESLTDEQIQAYLAQLNQLESWKILQFDVELLKLVRTPLFLSIFGLISFNKTLSVREWKKLPSSESRRQYLLSAYLKAALKRELVTQEMELRGLKSNTYGKKNFPGEKKTKFLLIWLSQQLKRESQTEFMLELIDTSWLLTSNQKLIFRIINIISIAFLVILIGCFGLKKWLVSLFFGLFIGLAFGRDNEIKIVEKFLWSWQGAKIGLILGLVSGLIEGFKNELNFNLFTAIFYIIILGLFFGLLFGLGEKSSEINIEKIKVANQGIKQSAVNAGIIGSLTMFCAILDSLIHELNNVMLVGTIAGFVISLNFGGEACIKYFFLRIILYFNGYIPWNYARFLDYCTERLLIQRVGGRYRFIHRLLQEHFAAMPLEK